MRADADRHKKNILESTVSGSRMVAVVMLLVSLSQPLRMEESEKDYSKS